MIANTKLIKKAAELGILRSLQDFLAEPLKPGRLKRRFLEIEMMIDLELKKVFQSDPNFFIDNRGEITAYLNRYNMIGGFQDKTKNEIHIASVIAFCIAFVDNSETKYPKKLSQYLGEIIDYYERGDNVNYTDMWKGDKFHKLWEELDPKTNDPHEQMTLYIWADNTWYCDEDICIDELVAHGGMSDDYATVVMVNRMYPENIDELITNYHDRFINGEIPKAFKELLDEGISPGNAFTALKEALEKTEVIRNG